MTNISTTHNWGNLSVARPGVGALELSGAGLDWAGGVTTPPPPPQPAAPPPLPSPLLPAPERLSLSGPPFLRVCELGAGGGLSADGLRLCSQREEGGKACGGGGGGGEGGGDYAGP